MNTMKINKQLINELTNKEYRDAFVSAHIDNGIPFQIRALRKQKGWTQKKLAEHIGMKQERISALENPNYSKFTLTTLKKLASAFDVALIVRFAPFGELVKWELELSPEALNPLSFDKDPYFKSTPSQVGVVRDLSTTCAVISAVSSPELNIKRYLTTSAAAVSAAGSIQLAVTEDQDKTEPLSRETVTDISKSRKASQAKLKSQLPQFMMGEQGIGEYNEAIGG